MAFEEIKSKGEMDVGMEGERGLVAGRSQREKRRSYKDLLREEEEIAAQVRKSSKKRPKDSEIFMLSGDSHKKKKKHSDEYYYRDHDGLGPPLHKKKHKSADRSPTLSSPSSSHPADTAMGLLQAITSPLATGSDPGPHLHKKPSYPSFSSHSSKDRKREGSSSGSKGSHSFSHSRPMSSSLSSSKKHSSSSSKSSLFHGGAPKEEPLTLREADGLKMKLIMSPKKEEDDTLPVSPHLSKVKKDKDQDRMPMSKSPKKKQQHSRDPLPVVGKEVEVEGHYGGGMGDDSSSSGGELEAGELVIDDSYTHLSKKKKKSKKSKKKKDKEKDRDKDKSGKDKKHGKDSSRSHSNIHPIVPHGAVGPMYTKGGPIPHHHSQGSDGTTEKKKKKEEKDREKSEKDKDKPKKKSASAYQVFCKEYRVNITAEQPGLVFGELSKKLAEVWKRMPEKDKLFWRQKAQYLQHKQNKAEATTVKHKSSSKSKGMVSQTNRAPVTVPLSPARVPEVDPIDAAAHLQLLGESLSLIGHRLQETEGMVAVSGSLSVLLDSILCALGPLTCLTAQIPQLNGCPRNVLSNTLDNIAYIMPGL
ncbi:HMG domain-containing protein 4a [Dunckerocampus dactyliophorus]|uniref:HMG domain-containing protein 4a n=1 Tax=Dunckerocampus dactyliophorus TaxID=161453 RepID=UPI002405C623|nr:HMG domain-containing protein 4a [Dunckerocampus dactyliophorus]XP_054616611.1 HMG domain-containing protein 4a [Dunckerocampus dactyliophorus]XP_054616612.1 HMG domain-containing protein 4a [Dunckerocampus dactyliophorus]